VFIFLADLSEILSASNFVANIKMPLVLLHRQEWAASCYKLQSVEISWGIFRGPPADPSELGSSR